MVEESERQAGRPRLYMMVGLPGAGKSTYARRYLPNTLRVSLDDIRLMLTGMPFLKRYEPAVAAVGEAALSAVLAGARDWGVDVVFDVTNVTRAWRRRGLKLAARFDVTPIAVYVETPIEVALERNRRRPNPVPDEVIHRFHSQLEPPSIDEGFDEVIAVVDFAV